MPRPVALRPQGKLPAAQTRQAAQQRASPPEPAVPQVLEGREQLQWAGRQVSLALQEAQTPVLRERAVQAERALPQRLAAQQALARQQLEGAPQEVQVRAQQGREELPQQ